MINKKPILVVFAISIALIFLMAPVAAASHSINPAVTSTSTGNYQPDPTLNTNATWATFHHGWSPLEYNNGTGNATLHTNMSTFYQNPISINPTDIQSHALNSTSAIPKNSSRIQGSNSDYTATDTGLTIDTNSTAATHQRIYWVIPSTSLPSNNPAYDYLTIEGKISGITQTGQEAQIGYYNSSVWQYYGVENNSLSTSTNYITNGPFFASVNLAYLNLTASKTNQIGIRLSQPEGATSTFTVNVIGFNITETQLNLGIQNGKEVSASANGNAFMQTFNPNFAWSSVINGGYSVALSASPNITEVQTPITSGNYIEQVQYSGTFELASAPDLSYGASNITFPLTVPADQVQVLTLGGSSYINSLGNKTNGTVQLVSGISPTSPTSYYAIVDYTASQWQSISHPAGFFTYDGIAYYYWLAIGAIASLLALGVGVRHAKTKREQTEKVDRITRRGR